MEEVLELAARLEPGAPPDERLTLARRAVLELLSEGTAKLAGTG
jgi:hypothetical protein